MIPHQYAGLAQIVHQERIAGAMKRRPEWAYQAASAPTRSVGLWSRIRRLSRWPALLPRTAARRA
jgi:hypothetical protein